jgi:hypothetical protein
MRPPAVAGAVLVLLMVACSSAKSVRLAQPDNEITPADLILDRPLPLVSQPPNPCYLLTTAEVTAAVGGHVDGVLGGGLAGSSSPERRCDWSVVWGLNDSGEVIVKTMTAAANTAARAALIAAGRGPESDVPALAVVFAQGHFAGACECSPIADTSLLGHPARYEGIGVGLSVLTPTALLAVSVDTSGHDFGHLHDGAYLIHERATAANLAKLALERLDPVCPCGHESAPTTPPRGILPVASQPPDPCHVLTTDEVTAILRRTAYDPGTAALADSSGGSRACSWAIEGSWSGGASLTIMTAVSQAESKASPKAASLRVAFDRDLLLGPFPGHAPFEGLTVLGYPAQYVSSPAWLQVLTPSALVVVSAAGQGIPHDEATLIAFAELALGHLGSTGR